MATRLRSAARKNATPAGRAPLLRLAPVELPAPSANDVRGHGSLAGRAALSVAMLLGVYVVALLVVLAMLGINYGIYRLGRIQFGVVIATFAVIGAVFKAMAAMVSAPPAPRDETEIPATEEPDLHATVRRLAEQVGTRPPDRIVVVADVNAYVYERGPFMGLVDGKRTLAIGGPLFEVLTVTQLEAVLAHELGHFAGGDTRLGSLAFRTEIALQRMVQSLHNNWSAAVFVAYWKLHQRVSGGVSRGQELAADRAAVRIAGRQAAADALYAIEIAANAHQDAMGSYIVPLIERGCRPVDMNSALRELLSSPVMIAELELAAAEPANQHPWASHPPTHVRIASVAALPEVSEVVADERAARVLLGDADRWITGAAELWIGLATRGADLKRVEWDEWPDAVVGATQRERASEVNTVLVGMSMPVGLAGVEAAFVDGRERELAAGLVRKGWRTGQADERETVLRVALSSVASHTAVHDAGARWELSWSGPVRLLNKAGEELDLTEPVAQALAGEWAPLRAATSEPRARRSRVAATKKSAETAAPAAKPVVPVATGEVWSVSLDKRLGMVTITVDDDFVTVDDAAMAIDDIAGVAIAVRGNDTARGFGAMFTFTDVRGTEVKTSVTGGRRTTEAVIRAAASELYQRLSVAAGPRMIADAVAAVRRGDVVPVGTLLFSDAGVAHKRKPTAIVPWKAMQDPWVDGDNVLVGGVEGKPLKTPIGGTNVFLLPDLVPELRTLFG